MNTKLDKKLEKNLEDKLFELKLVLDETMKFPNDYLFKFIVPVAEVHQILFILKDMRIEQKPSASGNYISVSAKTKVLKSDDIIIIYQRASVIKGIISL